MATFIFIDNGRIRPAPDTRIIKAADYTAIGPAAKLLEEARLRADGIVREAETVYRAEKQRGFQEGLRQARQEMAEQMATMALRTQQHYRNLEEQTVSLVMAIVGRVLSDIEPRELVVAQVKNALGAFKGRKQLIIKVNPAVARTLQQRFAEIMPDASELDVVEIKAAAHLAPEDLILESETGIVEASLETQLTAIESAIRKELQLPN